MAELQATRTDGPALSVHDARTAARRTRTSSVPGPLLLGLIVLLAVAPAPFGLVSPLAQAAFFSAAAFLALVAAWWCLARGTVPVSVGRLWPETLLFLLLLVWVTAQYLPWPGMAHPVWAEAGLALERETVGHISLAPDLTLEALLRLVGYAAVFWVALQLGRDRRAALKLMAAVVVVAVLYAAYGLIITLGDLRLILWYESDRPARNVIATFVNRNNFATYIGLGLIAAAGLLGGRLGGPVGKGRVALVELLRRFFSDGMLLFGAMAVTFTALLLSTSRGGFGASMVALFILGALGLLRVSRRTGGRIAAVVLAILPLPFVFGLSGERLMGRLLETDVDQEVRLSAFSAALRGIGDAPWTGFGYGAFQDAFQLYRDTSIRGWFDRLHNDWLEAIFGLGFVGAGLLFLVFLFLTVRCLVGGFRRRRDAFYPLTAVAASLLVGVHALSDFSLQLPAVTVTWLVLLALGVAQSWRTDA